METQVPASFPYVREMLAALALLARSLGNVLVPGDGVSGAGCR